MAERVYKGDTAVLDATLFDDDGVNPLQATSVTWTVLKPDGTTVTGTDSLEKAQTTILINATDVVGTYGVQVSFVLDGGTIKSTVDSFSVVDPLQQIDVTGTGETVAIERAYMKLEDIFDSKFGGPYLGDRTKKEFDQTKIALLVPDALYGINNSYQPATGFTDLTFPYDQHTPLMGQALLVESIYHLIRSYAEQPLPVGSNINYFDRRDYLTRWQGILQSEETKLNGWLDLFKRDQLGYASTATLLGGYAGTYARAPRYMRGRMPFIGARW